MSEWEPMGDRFRDSITLNDRALFKEGDTDALLLDYDTQEYCTPRAGATLTSLASG